MLPHLQNTGGFFVAVIHKNKLLPWEKEIKPTEIIVAPETNSNTTTETVSQNSENSKSAPWGPQRKKRRLHGYKEDPYVFFKEDEDVWTHIKSFYELNDAFKPVCLLTRSVSDKKKNIYFCSEQVRNLLLSNQDSIKIINTGVKSFVRCDNRNMKCSFRCVH